MRIYLAARYARRAEMERYAAQLNVSGHTVDARWIVDDGEKAERTCAIEDFEDIDRADVLIAFTEPPDIPDTPGASRGGRHVEFGMAVALKKPVIVVGPRENVFHHLPAVQQLDSWGPEILDLLCGTLYYMSPPRTSGTPGGFLWKTPIGGQARNRTQT